MIVAKNHPQLYARVPPRLQAFVRDMLVYIAITVIFLVLATFFPIQGVMTQTLVVAWLLALVLYEPLFVARAGGTIGHLSLNLRVVTASDLGPVSFPRAIVRAIVKAAVGIPVFLAVYFTAKHQGFHDLVAGTVVVPRDSSDIRSEWFAAERRRDDASSCRHAIWRRRLGSAMIVVATIGVAAFLTRFISVPDGGPPGPFETLSTAAGVALVLQYGYFARRGDPRIGSYWRPVLGPLLIGIGGLIPLLLLAMGLTIATSFRHTSKPRRERSAPLS